MLLLLWTACQQQQFLGGVLLVIQLARSDEFFLLVEVLLMDLDTTAWKEQA